MLFAGGHDKRIITQNSLNKLLARQSLCLHKNFASHVTWKHIWILTRLNRYTRRKALAKHYYNFGYNTFHNDKSIKKNKVINAASENGYWMLIYIVNMYIGIFIIPSWDPFADINVYINFLRFCMKLYGIKTDDSTTSMIPMS